MKKLFTLLTASLICSSSFAQLQNAGMETWHNYTVNNVALQTPDYWYGSDSVIAAFVQQYGALFGFSGTVSQQLFQESSTIYSGSYSAKLETVKQDTLGVLPGALSNAQPSIDIPTLIQTHNPEQSIVFSGGTSVTTMVYGVSAWVNYTSPGNDSGVIAVEALKNINSTDSVIGTAYLNFPPTNGFTWMDAHLTYTVSGMNPDMIRVVFLSSGSTPVEGSVLYVDEASLDLTTGVNNIENYNDAISVAPNPSTGVFYLHSASNTTYDVRVISVSGQTVFARQIAGNAQIDLSALPSGIYFYNLTGKDGSTRQGKLTLIK